MMHQKKGKAKRVVGAIGVLLLVLHVVMGIASCSSIECPVQNKVELVCQLADTLHDTLSVTSQRRNGTDTLLLNRGVNLTSMKLPLSYQNPVDTLVLKTVRMAVTDTVWVEKEDIPHFESVDCGLSYFHKIKSVRSTHLGIDTVIINKVLVDYDPSTAHLQFHFKARP